MPGTLPRSLPVALCYVSSPFYKGADRNVKTFAPIYPFSEQALGETKVKKKRISACKGFSVYLGTVAERERTGNCLYPRPPAAGHPGRTSSPGGTRPQSGLRRQTGQRFRSRLGGTNSLQPSSGSLTR